MGFSWKDGQRRHDTHGLFTFRCFLEHCFYYAIGYAFGWLFKSFYGSHSLTRRLAMGSSTSVARIVRRLLASWQRQARTIPLA
jgi:hypothetical protein